MCLFLFSTLVKVFTWKFDIVPSKRAEYTMLFKAYAQNWKNILLVIKSHGRFVTRSGEIDKRWRNWLHLLVELTSYMQKKYKGKKLGLSVQHAGEGNGNPLQYSCLENPVDRGTWRATVQGSQRVRHDWATEHKRSHHVAFETAEEESLILQYLWSQKRSHSWFSFYSGPLSCSYINYKMPF